MELLVSNIRRCGTHFSAVAFKPFFLPIALQVQETIPLAFTNQLKACCHSWQLLEQE